LLEALGFFLAVGFLRLLSPEAASNLGGFVGRTIGPRLGVTRRARRNLRLAFPEKTAAEIETIVRGMWDNLGRVAAEYPHLGRITAARGNRVELVNIDAVQALRDGSTAGILISAHLANWEILPVVAARNGFDLTGVVREPNNPYVRPLLERLRGVAGGRRTEKGAGSARQAVRALRENRVLGLLVDQKMNTGIAVPFFGVEAMTLVTPAHLAMRFQCRPGAVPDRGLAAPGPAANGRPARRHAPDHDRDQPDPGRVDSTAARAVAVDAPALAERGAARKRRVNAALRFNRSSGN
jgi:KDO2-lipid IV(A) lauroyltransferase